LHNLDELQKNFQRYLLQHPSQIKTAVIDTENLSSLDRLNIYQDAYYARLIEALCFDYTALHALIGNEEMRQLAKQYIDLYPSQFRSIRWYGKDLADFMRDILVYSQAPWLIEMAEFEWGLSKAFDVEDSPYFLITKMADIPVDRWHDLQFKINPSIQRLNFAWNVAKIWTTFTEKKKLIRPRKFSKIENWIIWRKEYDVQFCSLLKQEIYVLDAMASQESFGSICEGLCQWMEESEVAAYAASVLKRFLIDGVIIDVYLI
jgi:hypothetical protein